jgi:predicted amino acid-binding ACT domain protein
MTNIEIAAQALNTAMRAARDNTFSVVNHIRTRVPRAIEEDNGLLLAAFICDVAQNPKNPSEVSALVELLSAPDKDRNDARALVNASSLLCAAVQDFGSEQHQRLLAQIANYLGNPLMVERCRLLVESRLELTDDQFMHLIDITIAVQQLLAHPELLDGVHSSLEDVRRHEAARLVAGSGIVWRIETAPIAFVLSHEPASIAKAVAYLDPMPAGNTARVSIDSAFHSAAMTLRVVTHDAPSLLARITDAMREANLNILSADLATWPDGAVLDTFVVTAESQLSVTSLEQLINDRLTEFDLRSSMTSRSIECVVHVDDVAHPTNSVVTISGPDQPGVLSRIAAAFALSEIDVHHALITTDDGRIADSFEVTDRSGMKLSSDLVETLTTLLA